MGRIPIDFDEMGTGVLGMETPVMQKKGDIESVLAKLKKLRDGIDENSDKYSENINTVIRTLEWVLDDNERIDLKIVSEITI